MEPHEEGAEEGAGAEPVEEGAEEGAGAGPGEEGTEKKATRRATQSAGESTLQCDRRHHLLFMCYIVGIIMISGIIIHPCPQYHAQPFGCGILPVAPASS